jgi:hypothetical protein
LACLFPFYHAVSLAWGQKAYGTLRQPDAPHFVEAVITEFNGRVNKKHWQLTK